MDKIYSRKRIKLPKFFTKDIKKSKKMIKFSKVIVIVGISILTANIIIKSVSPIITKQCVNIAKSIATKISNEQATIVMSRYKYEDLCTVSKDSNGNIIRVSTLYPDIKTYFYKFNGGEEK